MYNDNQSRGRKETVLNRFRAALGPASAPSGLGLVFLLSMVHELARADTGEELSAQQLAELSARLVVERDDLLAVVDIIRGSYPEIADQLFGDQALEVTGGDGSQIDLLVLAEEITALEESGYLDREEILRLQKAFDALQAGDWSGDDIVVAQAGSAAGADNEAAAGDQTQSQAGKAEATTGAAEGGTEEAGVDIEALPPAGAGPLVAFAPLIAGGAAIAAVGILGQSSVRGAVADTSAPAYLSTSTSIATQKITLNYSEALNTTGQPLPGSFQVQTRPNAGVGWTDATITNVEVSGSTVTLSLQGTPLAVGRLLQVTYTDPSAGNDPNAIQDLAGNDAASVVITTGIVADGYVRGAQIYIDANGNGVAEAGERLEGVVTDANGNFFLPDTVNGPILAVGGVNIDTGVPNTMVMKAPAGSTMVTPLTTLVQTYIEQNGGTAASANAAVVSALGLTLPAGQTLATYDPLAVLASNGSDATALAVQKSAAQVATVVQAAAASPAAGTSATTVAHNVIANLVNQVETAVASSSHVDLTSTSTLTAVLASTGTIVGTAAVETATDAIALAGNLSTVVQAQANLLDTFTPIAPTSVTLAPASDTGASGDGITSTISPTLRVSLNVTATDGIAAVAGDHVQLYVNSTTQVGSSTALSATDIANGYVDIPVSGLPANASSNLTAKITDSVSHASAASAVFALTIDTTAPVAPGFGLALDSGVPGDGITNNGMVHVTGLEPGAGFQYSTDGGSHWTNGSGDSFTLPGSALYLAGAVQVRQVDVAGNTGAAGASSSSITVGLGTSLTIPTGAAETTTIHTLIAQGNADHYLTVLDLADNATTLNSTEAALLVDAGLAFATDDTVTVQQATGTHLTTSLSGLQHLGVDAIIVTGTGGEFVIPAGTGTLDYAHLPTITADSSVVVGLELADNLQNAPTTAGESAALKAAGIDVLMAADHSLSVGSTQLEAIHAGGLDFATTDSITMTIASANEAVAIGNLVTAIGTPGAYHGDLDVLDVVDNGIDISDAQAATLVQAGLHFAADDTTVALVQTHAAGTHLNTSLSDLQHLGVDYVHTDAGQDTLVVNFGSGLTSNTLPVFDATDEVKVVVQDSSLSQMVDFLNAPDKNDPHIDQLDVVLNTALGSTAGLGGNGILESAIQTAFGASSGGQHGIELEVANPTLSEVTLGMVLDAADASADSLHLLSGNSLVTALQAAGVTDINIDALTHFTISDSDLKPLLDAGLITAASGADIKVTSTDGALDVSLAQLANIGADHVQTVGATTVLDAGVSYSNLGDLQTALNGLVNTFNAQGVGTSASTALFENSDTVELRVAGDLSGQTINDATLLHKLELLGIDEIKDEHNHSIKPT